MNFQIQRLELGFRQKSGLHEVGKDNWKSRNWKALRKLEIELENMMRIFEMKLESSTEVFELLDFSNFPLQQFLSQKSCCRHVWCFWWRFCFGIFFLVNTAEKTFHAFGLKNFWPIFDALPVSKSSNRNVPKINRIWIKMKVRPRGNQMFETTSSWFWVLHT